MPKDPIKHASHPQMHWGSNSGTLCGRVIRTEDTVADPRDATCKMCLTHVTKLGKREMCDGCHDNFYNGNNQLGVKECWNLDTAKIVRRKKVGINDVPPWKHEPIRVLSCRTEKGFVFMPADKEY